MDRIVPVTEGAEAFVELLNACGVDYIFLNPGTDTYPVQEAIAKNKALGKRAPDIILCLHESVGLAAAHGYFMVTRKPQVVFVHVDVGIQQVGGALHNTQRGRIGVILCSGRPPSNIEENKRMVRSSFIHWFQDQPDQIGVVRNYVKWAYELRTVENIHHVVQRAFQIASSEPCGPVYLSLPVDVLREKMDSVTVPDITKYKAPVNPHADTTVLDTVATMLLEAEKPLIITGYSGRHPESVGALVALAEAAGARVVTSQFLMNFPTTHPLFAGTQSGAYIKDTDVILVIDCDVPYVPCVAKPKSDAKIIHIDIDAVKQNMPLWGFPVDFFLQCDSSKTMPLLTQMISRKVTQEQRSIIRARYQQLEKEHKRQREERNSLAESKAGQKPISMEWACRCVGEAIDEDTIVLEEPLNDNSAALRQIPRTRAGTFFQSGGGSLGWGLGAAIGAKLASPDKTIVALVGDGSFVFGCPTAALWMAGAYHAPFLCVIFNNSQYYAPKAAIRKAYGKDSYSEKTGLWLGVDILPSPEYARIAEACHAYGRVVEEPGELSSALKAALEQVRAGKAAVLDVRIERQ